MNNIEYTLIFDETFIIKFFKTLFKILFKTLIKTF